MGVGRRADQGPREGGRERERKAQRAMAARPKEERERGGGREREKGWQVKCFLRGMHARSAAEDRGRNHTPPRASNRVDDDDVVVVNLTGATSSQLGDLR